MTFIKSFKLRTFLLVILIIIVSLALSFGIITVTELTDTPFRPMTIVVDAGHGGRDNGAIGVNGTYESDINLAISLKLNQMLKDFGFKVILTRNNKEGLYNENATNYKVSDMEKRMDIINKAKPDFVVSIHQNSFSNSHELGAQAFYQKGNDEAKQLASSIQEILKLQIPNARKEANFGDYYILKESNYNAVLVECGYLTNPNEEALLNQEDYQQKIAYAITCGIVKYFDI